jgi:transposase
VGEGVNVAPTCQLDKFAPCGGAKRREQGLARAGNARVRRGMIQLAWQEVDLDQASDDSVSRHKRVGEKHHIVVIEIR